MSHLKALATALAIVCGFAGVASGQNDRTGTTDLPAATQPAEGKRPGRDGQKQKISSYIDQARQDLSSPRDQLPSMEPRLRMEKIRGVLSDLREKISGVLTDQQKSEFQQKLAALRQPLQAQRGGLVQRLHKAVVELDLTTDQRSRIRNIFDDTRSKFQHIREQADGDMRQIHQQGQGLARDFGTFVTIGNDGGVKSHEDIRTASSSFTRGNRILPAIASSSGTRTRTS